MVKEPTRNGRRGPRYRRMPDKSGLQGAAFCAAGMLCNAIRHRDSAKRPWVSSNVDLYVRIERAGMRLSTLWARIFAGQIDQHDTRVAEAMAEKGRLVALYCVLTEK